LFTLVNLKLKMIVESTPRCARLRCYSRAFRWFRLFQNLTI